MNDAPLASDDQYQVAADGVLTVNVQVRLAVASTAGAILDTVAAGESFVVNVYVQDLRAQPKGVFASYFDLMYDSTLVAVNGAIDYASDFPNGHRADAATIGTIVDVGGFAGFTELGGGEYRLVRVPFVALAGGSVDFVADMTNHSTGDDTLLYGLDNSIPLDQVRFLDASVQIGPQGEGEASGPPAFAAAADQAFAEEAGWLLP